MTDIDEQIREMTRPQEEHAVTSEPRPFVVSSVTTAPKGTRRRYTVVLSTNPDFQRPPGLPSPRPLPGPGMRSRPRPEPAFFGLTPTGDAVRPADRATVGPHPTRGSVSARRRRWPVIVALAAFALSIGVPLLLQALGHHDSTGRNAPAATRPGRVAPVAPSTAATTSSVRAGAVDWVRRSLVPGAAVMSDAATAAALRGTGMANAVAFGSSSPGSSQAVEYVLDVSGSTVSGGAAMSARTNSLAHSLPLAIFTSGTSRAMVRQVVAGRLDDTLARRADDRTLRETGGRELLQNPALVFDASMRDVLRRGTLDLRVQNVLSDLASTGRIRVLRPVQDPAEARAGQPIRSVVLVTDRSAATQTILRALPAPYRPESIARLTPHSLRVVWLPSLATELAAGD